MSSTTPSKLLIDCSSTRTCNFNSGIQRVVRSICEQANNVSHSAFAGLPVYGENGNWYHATSLWPEPVKNDPDLNRLGPMPDCHPAMKLPFKVLRELRRCSQRIKKWRGKRSRYTSQKPPVEMGEGDVLLLADAGWQVPNWEAIQAAKKRGVTVGILFYDLIPIQNPEFFQPELSRRFKDWFEHVVSYADFAVCISKAVQATVARHWMHPRRESNAAPKLDWFRLGCELKAHHEFGPPAHCVQEWFSGPRAENPYLVVGTIEPRKNHRLILGAFDRLWRSGSQARLCITGRVGWNCDSILETIRNHDKFGSLLLLNTQASDDDVHYAYQSARGVIMASKNEGFGLPIVEGLGYEQAVFASDIPVHREVGGSSVQYFELDADGKNLASQLIDFEATGTQSQVDRISENVPRMTTWSESYLELCDRIERLVTPGSILRAAEAA